MQEAAQSGKEFLERFRSESRDYFYSAAVARTCCIQMENGMHRVDDAPYEFIVLSKRKGRQEGATHHAARERLPGDDQAVQHLLHMLTTVALTDARNLPRDDGTPSNESPPDWDVERQSGPGRESMVIRCIGISMDDFEELYGTE